MAMKDLLVEIEQLAIEEQLALLEALSRQIRLTMQKNAVPNLRGILKTDTLLPDDDSLQQSYIDYLEEKYR